MYGTEPKRSGFKLPLRGIALATLAIVLLGEAILNRGESLLNGPVWALQETSNLKRLLFGFAISEVVTFLSYAVLSFLATQSIQTQTYRFKHANRPFLLAFASGIGLSVVTSVIAAGPGLHWPVAMDMVVPAFGSLFGAWIGLSWLAGGRLRKSIVPKIVLLLTSCFALALALVLLATEDVPIDIEPTEVTSVDRVRLTQLIRSKSPRNIPDGRTVTLSLVEEDVNILLAWGLSLGSKNRAARVDLSGTRPSLRVSVRLPTGRRLPRYLNFIVTGMASVSSGVLDLQIDSLKVGRLDIPWPLLGALSAGIEQKIQLEPLAAPLLAEIHSAGIYRGKVAATYRRIDMPAGFRERIFGSIGSQEQVSDALFAQFSRIARIDWDSRTATPRFEAVLRGAFRLAHQRSKTSDPVVENRAALIALGFVFGHSVIGELVGEMPSKNVAAISTSQMRQMQIQGRSDWSRHFLVSAAIEVISEESLSHDIGVLKEELDAGTEGGSGFSFADLAADRAGTLLAKIATRDKKTARKIQVRLMGDSDKLYVFSDIAELPENISQQQFLARYGGLTGNTYLRLVAQIDMRISNNPLYQGLLQ